MELLIFKVTFKKNQIEIYFTQFKTSRRVIQSTAFLYLYQ